ncbi:MAG: hypothetical protein MUC67_00715 [Acidobacteria bacterium]|jgi:hypothetical protein|nr:hypothetical protein [Acidobacteriota bacterium]
MSTPLRTVARLLLAVLILALPAVAPADDENPWSLGSPNVSDNPNIEPNIFGGDSGSPWPFAVQNVRRDPPPLRTGSVPPGSATAVAPPGWVVVPVPLPGAPPGLVWLPLPAQPPAGPGV